MKLGTVLLDLLFPPRCPFCGTHGVHGVCEDCRKKLPRNERCVSRGSFGKCVSPLPYTDTVRDSLLRFKFHGARTAAEGYGRLLAECVAQELTGEFDCVTWVPVSEQRLRERGYDQAFLLARETARLWDTAPIPMLCKIRNNAAQSGLSSASQRRTNVVGVYRAIDPDGIRGKRILLIDDILTTGSTMSECVRVLKEAGASGVVCATLARADRIM